MWAYGRTRPSVVWGGQRVNGGGFPRLRYNPAMREAAEIAAARLAAARQE
jgi:hypothetical protein